MRCNARNNDYRVRDIIEKLFLTNDISSDETVFLIQNANDEDKRLVYDKALETKQRYYGKKVYMRGLIEFSNICSRNCLYCGLRAQNSNVDRYRLSKEEILECCRQGRNLGYFTFVLQSGEDPYYTIERMEDIIKAIKSEYPECALTLSIGERSFEEYKRMKDAGADRFLLRHETASRQLYEKLHPDMSFDKRTRCLYDLKKAGFQVGAGFMVGLPGQTEEMLAEDLHFLKKLNPEMIGIGPFIPHSKTPLKEEKGGNVEDTIFMVALARLFVPKALIPATTALGTLHEKGRELALKAGANVVMPNLTPLAYRPKYQLYENKICTGDDAAHCRVCIEKRITSAGFEIDMGRGDHVNFVNFSA